MDPKTWTLFLFNIAINIPNGGMHRVPRTFCPADNSGLTTFSGIIINNLGFSPVTTSLLNMPTGIMSTLSAFGFSWLAARWTNRRCLVTMIAACLPIIGSVVVYTLPRTNIAGQMVGIYLVGYQYARVDRRSSTNMLGSCIPTSGRTLSVSNPPFDNPSQLMAQASPWARQIPPDIRRRTSSTLFFTSDTPWVSALRWFLLSRSKQWSCRKSYRPTDLPREPSPSIHRRIHRNAGVILRLRGPDSGLLGYCRAVQPST